jgi:nanoRNase/pAp phosphatase (c-di-AMP/oligoRNAs hydrolase)
LNESYVPEWLRERGPKLLELADRAGTPIVVTAHRNADPDAYAAAKALRDALRSLDYDARLVLPEGMSQPTKRLVREVLGVEPAEAEDEAPDESAMAVVVDTASPEQLGSLADFALKVILVVVDHHEANKLVDYATLSLHDRGARATSEIVYMLVEKVLEVELDEKTRTLLLAGIVYDTRHFVLSTPRVLRVAADLMDSGADLDRALKALQSPPMEASERIARLKAAQRCHVYRAGDYLVAITHVGAFESSVARALLDLGADVAIVVSEHGSEVRVIGRARKSIVEGLQFNLGRDVMEPLGKMLGGSGGGHAQAAGASARVSLERAIDAVTEVLKHYFESKGVGFQPIA